MRCCIKILALAAVLVSGPALAQPPAGLPSACEASKVSKSDVDRAHSVYLSGKQFLEESNYDKAIGYFEDAYTIDCSMHAILPIIATAYERKGDKSAAVAALQEYLKRAPDAPDHGVVERRIRNLDAQLAAEQPPSPAPAPAPAPPATSTAAPAPAPPPQAPPPREEASSTSEHSLPPWLLVGGGGVAVAAGIVSYIIGAGDISSAENACPTRNNCSSGDASQGNDGRTLETVGFVAGGVGLAAIAGGLYWHFTEGSGRSTSVAPVAVAGPGFVGVGVRRGF